MIPGRQADRTRYFHFLFLLLPRSPDAFAGSFVLCYTTTGGFLSFSFFFFFSFSSTLEYHRLYSFHSRGRARVVELGGFTALARRCTTSKTNVTGWAGLADAQSRDNRRTARMGVSIYLSIYLLLASSWRTELGFDRLAGWTGLHAAFLCFVLVPVFYTIIPEQVHLPAHRSIYIDSGLVIA